jgi:hypothetical protein
MNSSCCCAFHNFCNLIFLFKQTQQFHEMMTTLQQPQQLSGFGFSNSLHLDMQESINDKMNHQYNIVFKYYDIARVDHSLAIKMYVV